MNCEGSACCSCMGLAHLTWCESRRLYFSVMNKHQIMKTDKRCFFLQRKEWYDRRENLKLIEFHHGTYLQNKKLF